MAARQYDVVVLGATGFTGRLISKHLARKQQDAAESFTWAIAGRSEAKLTNLASALGVKVPYLVADTSDAKSLDAVCSSCSVCISCTGPFDLYGMPVVEACVRNRTHYVDITGEFTFVRRVIERFHEQAQREGILLVSQAGFDSVPSDLVNYLVYDFARSGNSRTTVRSVEAYFSKLGGGGPSRGTYDSSLNILKSQTKADLSPYSLVPQSARAGLKSVWPQLFLSYNGALREWTYPFIMSAANERLVRRTNYLLGSSASYVEAASSRGLVGAIIGCVAYYIIVALIVITPLQRLVQKLIPAAGEGPSDQTMAKSGFKVQAVAQLEDGRQVRATVQSKLGGYPSTAVFASEVALCIAHDIGSSAADRAAKGLPVGGALTAMSSCDSLLLPRLRRHGITTSVEVTKTA